MIQKITLRKILVIIYVTLRTNLEVQIIIIIITIIFIINLDISTAAYEHKIFELFTFDFKARFYFCTCA